MSTVNIKFQDEAVKKVVVRLKEVKCSTQYANHDGRESLTSACWLLSFQYHKELLVAFSAVWINFCCFSDQVTQDKLENRYKSWEQGFICCETEEIGTQSGSNVTTGWLNGGVRRRGCLICPCSLQEVSFFHSKLWILNAGCKKLGFRQLSRPCFLRVFTEYVFSTIQKKNQKCWTSKTQYL